MTGEEATLRGYRKVSNKYKLVARIDRPDWIDVLARSMRRSPAEFYVPGESLPAISWCDQYRRVYSKDQLKLSSEEFKKVPSSWDDPIGFVPYFS